MVIYAGLIFAVLAALLHVYIFVMESLTWTSAAHPRDVRHHARRRRETTKELAFNQGFYNLFLAIVTAVGIVIGLNGHRAVGRGAGVRGRRVDARRGSGAAGVVTRQGSRGRHAGNFPADRDRAPGDRVDDVASPCEAIGWPRCSRFSPCSRVGARAVRPIPGRPGYSTSATAESCILDCQGDRLADGIHHSRQGQLRRGVELRSAAG